MQSGVAAESAFKNISMSDRLFKRFGEFIYKECGIKLPPAKKTMLTVRLFRRLRALGMNSFGQYYDYVCSPESRSGERIRMIDAVSTNKTDFFREPAHFDILGRQALPDLVGSMHNGSRKKLNVWSAGCSSGEEPYTLAMVLSEFFTERQNKAQADAKSLTRPLDQFSILATDISIQVLETAKKAIYPKQMVNPVPPMMKRKYLMHGTGSQKEFYRMVPELRSRITFQRLNFMENNFGIRMLMDIIFCRNVIIYFDRQTQIKLFEKFYNQLAPGGYLFIGHSESLHGINNRFRLVATTTYKKPGKATGTNTKTER
ncbi:chemotaxis protein methyltransferase CheR [Desulfosarcina sp. BuS5]|uniref:CheR family methyltransferase n=1 Tax=Desulfosarcina sp. BuS5 TaxID=933262 RepID=UPI00068879B5|nr:protein-glutamate O-methyltransferase [Desulfosarcina sp. BuS5]WDN89355.1 chemotaxis protein methyltransferase CheR [Desulfosarcina sp. BuS5]